MHKCTETHLGGGSGDMSGFVSLSAAIAQVLSSTSLPVQLSRRVHKDSGRTAVVH